MNVRFFAGSKSQYLGIAKHNPIALYFCHDTRELFWGDKLLSDGIRIVATEADLPSLQEAADGIIYHVEESRNGYVLSADRSKWIHVIQAPGAGNAGNTIKAISFAGTEMEEVDGVFTIDRRCAREALGFIVPEGLEDEEIAIATEDFVKSEIAKAEFGEVEVNLENYYTKDQTDEAIAEAVSGIEVPEVDLSSYATKEELSAAIDSIEHPTVDLAGYATEQWVSEQGFLKEHQDISGKADIDHNHDDLYEAKGAAEAVKNEILNGAGEAFDTLKELNDLIVNNKDAIEAIETIAVGKADKEHTHDQYLTEHQSLDGYAKTEDIANFITMSDVEDKGYLTEHQDLSDYALKSDIPNLTGYAKVSDIPDVSKFITEIPDEYLTESELEAKGFITEHQDLSEYAKKTELPVVDGFATTEYVDKAISGIEIPSVDSFITMEQVEAKNYLTEVPAEFVTESELAAKGYITEHQSLAGFATEDFVKNAIAEAELNDKDVDISGLATKDEIKNLASVSYVDEQITAIEIPSIDGLASEDFVNEAIAAIKHPTQDLSEYAKKSDLFSKDYNELVNTPEIPSIDGLATETYVNEKIAAIETPEAVTKVSELENDAGYITITDIANKADKDHTHDYAAAEHEHEQYLTEQSLVDYAKTEDLFSKDYNDLANKPEIPNVDNFITMEQVEAKNYLTEVPTDYAKKSDIPSLDGYAKTEDIPTDYLTEADLAGYSKFSGSYNDLTDTPEIPSVDGLASESYVDEAIKNVTVDTSNLATIEQLNAKANDILFTESKIVKTPVGGFVVDEDVNGLTIAQLFAKLLGLVDKSTEDPGESNSLINKILEEGLAMYSVTADGELARAEFKVLDGNAAPTESGFFVIRDENGEIEKAGYQDLSVVSDELYYIIALPKELDYNTMVVLEAWDSEEKVWVESDMHLISEPSLVAGFCDEVGVDISGIDQNAYTIWVYEDVCTGSILRYVIKEQK